MINFCKPLTMLMSASVEKRRKFIKVAPATADRVDSQSLPKCVQSSKIHDSDFE